MLDVHFAYLLLTNALLTVVEFEIFDRFHAIIKTTIAKTRSIYVTITTLINKGRLNSIVDPTWSQIEYSRTT